MKKTVSLCLIALSAFILYSCDNSLNPVIKNKGIYVIYGYLDINSDTNYIRVKNLKVPLRKATANTFNGTVTLTNLDNGASQILQDSIVVLTA